MEGGAKVQNGKRKKTKEIGDVRMIEKKKQKEMESRGSRVRKEDEGKLKRTWGEEGLGDKRKEG